MSLAAIVSNLQQVVLQNEAAMQLALLHRARQTVHVALNDLCKQPPSAQSAPLGCLCQTAMT